MARNKTLTRGIICLFISTLLVGCAGSILPEKASKAVVRIKTSQALNPDSQGRPSPIVLYIYQLKSDDGFKNAPFFELYENAASILGQDLLGQQEIEMSPEEKIELDKLTLDEKTQYYGFMAAYRDIDNAIWRAAVNIPAGKTSYLEVSLGKLSIAVSEGKRRSKFLD